MQPHKAQETPTHKNIMNALQELHLPGEAHQAVHHGSHSHVDDELHLGARSHTAQVVRGLPHGAVHRPLRAFEQRLVTAAQEDQGTLCTTGWGSEETRFLEKTKSRGENEMERNCPNCKEGK